MGQLVNGVVSAVSKPKTIKGEKGEFTKWGIKVQGDDNWYNLTGKGQPQKHATILYAEVSEDQWRNLKDIKWQEGQEPKEVTESESKGSEKGQNVTSQDDGYKPHLYIDHGIALTELFKLAETDPTAFLSYVESWCKGALLMEEMLIKKDPDPPPARKEEKAKKSFKALSEEFAKLPPFYEPEEKWNAVIQTLGHDPSGLKDLNSSESKIVYVALEKELKIMQDQFESENPL